MKIGLQVQMSEMMDFLVQRYMSDKIFMKYQPVFPEI